MRAKKQHKIPKMSGPAIYKIRVRGHLDDTWSDRLGGMQISESRGTDGQPESVPCSADAPRPYCKRTYTGRMRIGNLRNPKLTFSSNKMHSQGSSPEQLTCFFLATPIRPNRPEPKSQAAAGSVPKVLTLTVLVVLVRVGIGIFIQAQRDNPFHEGSIGDCDGLLCHFVPHNDNTTEFPYDVAHR